MISYITIGADDITRAKRFYDAVLKPLGHQAIYETDSWLGYGQADGADHPKIWVCNAYNGKPATAGNGSMVGIYCPTPDDVDAFYANGLAAGGTGEGSPGRRPHYNQRYYLAYLRDPQGNKISAFYLAPEK